MEQTQPNIFHIHVDGRRMPADLGRMMLEELGFYDHHFIGHPGGYQHFEPNYHLTRKLAAGSIDQRAREFKEIWKKLEALVSGTDFVGYLEGEFIPTDIVFPEKPYDDSIAVPFLIERRRLRDGENFRESEIHLVMDKDKSHERLITKLLDSGLYGAFLPKKDHTAVVLTMQGYRADILPLRDALVEYLNRAGGVVRGTIKEERAIKYELLGIKPSELPEIAGRVVYR